ncbi:hypothetical protein EDC30_11921 [Paucimonas lemoignei]|uniref:CopG family transcriptional regulator n=1 Tax=Paucimonas lemoignei TaxID=29443 RepID=A0A4R3HPB9_PAULE|nr:CopG family transcriptional regulator [Paucimonas lemoignei]TCS32910.1 hypothetical protein EDC30_11921 [Paucimonas lemoignei]
MAIIPTKPQVSAYKNLDAFIAGGEPAFSPEKKKVKKAGCKQVITLTISPATLARIDDWARNQGISRAAAVAVAISKLTG